MRESGSITLHYIQSIRNNLPISRRNERTNKNSRADCRKHHRVLYCLALFMMFSLLRNRSLCSGFFCFIELIAHTQIYTYVHTHTYEQIKHSHEAHVFLFFRFFTLFRSLFPITSHPSPHEDYRIDFRLDD